MKRDPLDMTISLIFNLNLLEKNETYNINELKTLRNLDFHWNTIFKYLKIFKLIQKYCPNYELTESKLHVINTKIFDRLNEKEKFILHLYNKHAIDSNNATEVPNAFNNEQIYESLGVLYEKLDSGKFYLNKAGMNVYRSIKQNLSDIIINEKEINEIFPKLFYREFEKPNYQISINIENIHSTFAPTQNLIYIPQTESDIFTDKKKEILLQSD